MGLEVSLTFRLKVLWKIIIEGDVLIFLFCLISWVCYEQKGKFAKSINLKS